MFNQCWKQWKYWTYSGNNDFFISERRKLKGKTDGHRYRREKDQKKDGRSSSTVRWWAWIHYFTYKKKKNRLWRLVILEWKILSSGEYSSMITDFISFSLHLFTCNNRSFSNLMNAKRSVQRMTVMTVLCILYSSFVGRCELQLSELLKKDSMKFNCCASLISWMMETSQKRVCRNRIADIWRSNDELMMVYGSK